MCESALAGSRNNHRPAARMQRVDLFSLLSQQGDPRSSTQAEARRWELNSVHTRRSPACWFHLFLSRVHAGADFTTMLWFSLCFLISAPRPWAQAHLIGHLQVYQTPVLSMHGCATCQTQSTKSSRHNLYIFLHCFSSDFIHSQLGGHLSVFTILLATLPFWSHPLCQSSDFSPFLPTVRKEYLTSLTCVTRYLPTLWTRGWLVRSSVSYTHQVQLLRNLLYFGVRILLKHHISLYPALLTTNFRKNI